MATVDGTPRYYQFLFSPEPMLTQIDGSFIVGATGAVASTGAIGTGVKSVTRQGTGKYTIQLSDNYNRFIGANFSLLQATSAAGVVQDGSFVIGQSYKIVNPSTSTNWQVVGLPNGLTAVAGMPFTATSGASNGATSGAVGTGTATALKPTGIASIEVLQNPNLTLSPSVGYGAYVQFVTLNTSNAPADPTSGATVRFDIMLRKSTLLLRNETATNY